MQCTLAEQLICPVSLSFLNSNSARQDIPPQFMALISTFHVFDRNKRPHNPNIIRDSLVQISICRVLTGGLLCCLRSTPPCLVRQRCGASVATVLSLPAFFLVIEITLSVVKTVFR